MAPQPQARSSDRLRTPPRTRTAKGRPPIAESQERDVLNALLSAAKQCVETTEASQITVRQIAEIAHVNQAMINYYFESKDGLFSSLFTKNTTDLVRKLDHYRETIPLGDETTHSVETLMKVIEDHFDHHAMNWSRPDFRHEDSRIRSTYSQGLASRSYASVVRIMAEFIRLGRCRQDMSSEQAGYVVASLCVFPFVLSPVFEIGFNTKVDGQDREDRRRLVAKLLETPPA